MKHARSELENYEVICRQNARRIDREIVVPEDTPTEDSSDDEEDLMLYNVRNFYEERVCVSAEELQNQLLAPQRSPLWHKAREHCITASVFGTANGTNPYQSAKDLVREKLWGTFKGNFATAYGTAHEDDARFEFEAFAKENWPGSRVESPNIYKFVERPWMAVSPDGFLHKPDGTLELIEYKCPLRQTDAHPYSRYEKCIPPYYHDQIQGIMGHLNDFGFNISVAWFVVWQQHQTWIMKVPFLEDYWDTKLYPNLHAWYFEQYLPAATHKANGVLGPNEIEPTFPIEL